MLSLPLITPRDDSPLYPTPLRPSFPLDPSSTPSDPTQPPNAALPPPHRRPGSHQNHHHHHPRSTHPFTSPLALLAAEENIIAQRKQNVRRFGAGWIRPPGVAKTYQATMDEAAEREEQEMLARREQALLELASAQEEAAAREAAAGAGEEGDADADADGTGIGQGERDLDDDVPEAVEEESASEGGSEREGEEGEMTFNESSFLEGSVVAADVEQMLEMEEAEMAGVLQDERDLDDDVPEAGSYQHTDTELEDSSSEGELASSVAPGSSARRSGGRSGAGVGGARMGGGRNLFNEDGSEMGESSLMASSPAAARAPGLGNAFRNRLMGPRGPRGG